MPSYVHVNQRLSDVSQSYPHEFESLGDYFFEKKGVEHLSDQFVQVSKPNLLSLRDLVPMSDDSVPPEIQLKWDADTTFNCKVYALSSPDKWITTRNADPSLDYETQRTIQLTLSLRLQLEYLQVNQRLRDTSVNTNTSTLTAAQRFDNYASSSSAPIETMKLIVDNIGYATGNGKRPNRIAMTSFTLSAISNSEDFRDRVKYTTVVDGMTGPSGKRPANGIAALVEAMIGVEPGTIRIADHVYNSAANGQTAAYKTFIGSDILFAYVEPLGLRKWSFSAGFQWSAVPNSPTSIIAVPQLMRGVMQGEEFRAFSALDPKVLQPSLGYLLKGCLDTSNASYNNLLD
jgi:hypothetical protein